MQLRFVPAFQAIFASPYDHTSTFTSNSTLPGSRPLASRYIEPLDSCSCGSGTNTLNSIGVPADT